MRLLAQVLFAFFLCGSVTATELPKAEPSKIKALTFVAIAEPRLPSAEQVRSALAARLGSVKIDGMETDDQKVILFRVRGGTVAIGVVDRPLPKDELEHMCKWAWHWRQACDALASHKAHLHVMILDTDLDRVGAALLQTSVVASLMDSNALASYWGTSLHSKDSFLKQAGRASTDSLPIWLWINFRMTNDLQKGWTVSTQGLEAFGLYEIESRDVVADGRKIFGLVSGMAEYLIKKGPVIKDGETIGHSPAENIRVRHAPSYWNEGKTVYRVVFPSK